MEENKCSPFRNVDVRLVIIQDIGVDSFCIQIYLLLLTALLVRGRKAGLGIEFTVLYFNDSYRRLLHLPAVPT